MICVAVVTVLGGCGGAESAAKAEAAKVEAARVEQARLAEEARVAEEARLAAERAQYRVAIDRVLKQARGARDWTGAKSETQSISLEGTPVEFQQAFLAYKLAAKEALRAKGEYDVLNGFAARDAAWTNDNLNTLLGKPRTNVPEQDLRRERAKLEAEEYRRNADAAFLIVEQLAAKY